MPFSAPRAIALLALITITSTSVVAGSSRAPPAALPPIGTLPQQITGFLQPKNAKSGLFYWLFPARAPDVNASTAPLLVWLQGGPGASSLLGLLYENGPFRLAEGADASNATASTPAANAFAWNERANLVYIDQPFGTGFSFADDDADLVTSMPEMAKWLRLALVELAAAQPRYASVTTGAAGGGRALWLSGESYAGKYIPYLATAIMAAPAGDALAGALTRGGLAIGDGWVDPQVIVGTYPARQSF